MKSLAVLASIVILSLTIVISIIVGFFVHKVISFGKIWYLLAPIIVICSFFATLQILRIINKIREKLN
jgi:ABC-type iron transport system FetAB permease component